MDADDEKRDDEPPRALFQSRLTLSETKAGVLRTIVTRVYVGEAYPHGMRRMRSNMPRCIRFRPLESWLSLRELSVGDGVVSGVGAGVVTSPTAEC